MVFKNFIKFVRNKVDTLIDKGVKAASENSEIMHIIISRLKDAGLIDRGKAMLLDQGETLAHHGIKQAKNYINSNLVPNAVMESAEVGPQENFLESKDDVIIPKARTKKHIRKKYVPII